MPDQMSEVSREEELILLYVLGVLEGEELEEAERLIDSNTEEVKRMLADYESVVSLLPYAAKPAVPSPDIKKKLLADVRRRKSREIRERTAPVKEGFFAGLRPLWLGAGALASAALVFLAVTNITLRSTIGERDAVITSLNDKLTASEERVERLENLIATKEGELGGLETKLASLEQVTDFMKDQDIVLIQLSSKAPELKASGRVLWDKNEHDALLYCLDMPDAPEGKTYQWWVIIKGRPRSMGIFDVNEEGDSIVHIDSLKKFGDVKSIEAFKVTLEPDGGAEAPTGKPLIAGASI
ncbi:MAG TPA: anti-sigma factor [Thermodesulfobacteriota bacterium]|nr:anti-sigma factor [Thermodesulfobacteriota bacterium]